MKNLIKIEKKISSFNQKARKKNIWINLDFKKFLRLFKEQIFCMKLVLKRI